MVESINGIISSDPYYPSTTDVESIISPTQAREISIAQRAVWKKVAPYALNANGRTGYDVRLNNAYVFGYWQVDWEYDELHIDLDFGDLVHWDHSDVKWKYLLPAPDEEIERYVVRRNQPKVLDAQGIINKLKMKANGENFYPKDVQKEWRLERAEECGFLGEFLKILEKE